MLERIFINLGFSFIICFLEHGKSCLLYNQAFAYLLFLSMQIKVSQVPSSLTAAIELTWWHTPVIPDL